MNPRQKTSSLLDSKLLFFSTLLISLPSHIHAKNVALWSGSFYLKMYLRFIYILCGSLFFFFLLLSSITVKCEVNIAHFQLLLTMHKASVNFAYRCMCEDEFHFPCINGCFCFVVLRIKPRASYV